MVLKQLRYRLNTSDLGESVHIFEFDSSHLCYYKERKKRLLKSFREEKKNRKLITLSQASHHFTRTQNALCGNKIIFT